MSRETWLEAGDHNTQFFQKMARGHQRQNTIKSLIKDERRLEEGRETEEHIVEAFESLYNGEVGYRPKLDGEALNLLVRRRQGLEDHFKEKEIKEAVFGEATDEVSGPYGFFMGFVRGCWDIIKENVIRVFDEFHERKTFQKSLNATFIALISKMEGAENVGNFRPISLVGFVYKILAKALASRLKGLLDKVISKSQQAFVKGRQILDALFIANECVDDLLKMRRNGVLYKLDIENVYNHAAWSFFQYIMRRMGFGQRWIE